MFSCLAFLYPTDILTNLRFAPLKRMFQSMPGLIALSRAIVKSASPLHIAGKSTFARYYSGERATGPLKMLVIDGYAPKGREDLRNHGCGEAGHLYRVCRSLTEKNLFSRCYRRASLSHSVFLPLFFRKCWRSALQLAAMSTLSTPPTQASLPLLRKISISMMESAGLARH